MTILFSLDTTEHKPSQWTYERLIDVLKDGGFRAVQCAGKYKGIEERSIMITLAKQDTVTEVLAIARRYKQESILIVDGDYHAHLMDCLSKETKVLGKWVVSSREPSGDHTRTTNGTTNTFYSVLG